MPIDVQEKMVRSVPGLENAVFAKYAYAMNMMQLTRNN